MVLQTGNTSGSINSATSDALRNTASPDPLLGRHADLLLSIRTGLYEFGKRAARDAGSLNPDSQILVALAEHATKMAQAECPLPFSVEYESDRLLWNEHAGRLHSREALTQSIAWSEARFRERVMEMAAQPALSPRPRFLWFVVVILIIAFSASLSPSLQAITGTPPTMRGWVLPLALSLFIASAVCVPPIYAVRLTTSGYSSMLFVLGGLIISLGLGTFRFLLASTAESWAIAAGLLGIEIGCCVILEALARSFRRHLQEWEQRREALDRLKREVEASERELRDQQQRLTAINGQIDQFINFVRDRNSLAAARQSLERDAVATIRSGYLAGISENKAQAGRSRSGVR